MRRFVKNVRGMSRPARAILRAGLALSCVMLAAALLILVFAGDRNAYTYPLHYLARELYTAPSAVLLLSVFGSAILEEKTKK